LPAVAPIALRALKVEIKFMIWLRKPGSWALLARVASIATEPPCSFLNVVTRFTCVGSKPKESNQAKFVLPMNLLVGSSSLPPRKSHGERLLSTSLLDAGDVVSVVAPVKSLPT
jgi:hypothetical protein